MRNQESAAKQVSRRFRKAMSPAEVVVWSKLKSGQIGFLVRRQFAIGPYFLDFYIPVARLCIEIDGASHEFSAERDKARDILLTEFGVLTVRFSSLEVGRDPDLVAQQIHVIACARSGRNFD